MEEKRARAQKANELLRVIASCGRTFFSGRREGDVSRLYVDYRGHVVFWDAYSVRDIRLSYKYWGWKQGFSHGGTLRDFVNALAWYIRTGEPIPDCHLSRWPDNYWGYGDDMEKVRAKAVELGIYLPEAQAEAAAG